MLQLYDLNKVKIRGLKIYKDLNIESNLSTADKSLSFLYPSRLSKEIVEEGYIRTKTDEFVIKQIETRKDYKAITAVLNIEDLEGRVFEHFDTSNESITGCLNLALAGTGWTIGTCDVTRRRTVRKTNSSTWEIIQEAKKNYRAELEFDTLNKKINIFEKRGNDKGTYFIDSLNLKSLDIESNSYDFYTRIIAIGKDDLKVTLENFQYSKKVKTFIWKDERYTQIDSLREDAAAKLNELSKPRRAYSASILDLANINLKYKEILGYSLGDTISLISKDKEIKEKQRIVKIIEYPEEPERNTCEIANTLLKFEDIQKEQQDTSDTVDNITTDNGTVDGSTIDSIKPTQIDNFEASIINVTNLTAVNARIDNLYAKKADIDSLNAVIINVGNLYATKANITDLKAINATIDNLIATTAKIVDLTAINAKINVLEVNTGNINTLLAGNLTSKNIQAGGINSDRLTIQNGFITNLMVSSLDVSKINAGIISTSKFQIKSDDGGIEIVGATQQFKDKNNKVRIQMGKDTQGNFNFILRGEDGVTTLIDHTGIKKNAIANDLIVADMIGKDAIGEKQIDYSSFADGFNKDTNINTIKSTHIKLDNQNQTLDLAFNSLKTQSDGTKSLTETNSTAIGVQQGQINIAIANSQIIKDGKTILLKDDYNTTVATVNSINTTIGKHQSTLDAHTKEITGVTTQVTEVNKSLDGITQRVSSSETNINNVTKTANQGVTDALSAKAIADKAVKDAQNAQSSADNIKVGSRNLLLDSGIPVTTTSYMTKQCNISEKMIEGIQYTISLKSSLPVGQTKWGIYINGGNIVLSSINRLEGTQIYTVTFLGKTGGTAIGIADFIQIFNMPNNTSSATIEWVKLELGNKATDWTPAPEDVQKQLDKALQDALNAQKQANKGVEDANNAQTQANKAVLDALNASNKAGQSLVDAKNYTNAQITTVNTSISNNVSEINQLKKSIELKVEQTQVDTSISKIKIGGRNLLRNTNFQVDSSFWTYSSGVTRDANKILDGRYSAKSIKSSCTSDNWSGIYQAYPIAKQGDEFTASVYTLTDNINVMDNGATMEIRYYNGSTRITQGSVRITPTSNNVWERFVLSVICPAGTTRVEFCAYLNRNGTIWFNGGKLETGNKATSHTVAPEDTDQAIADVITVTEESIKQVKASIKIETDSITQKVTNSQIDITKVTKEVNNAQGTANAANGTANNLRDNTIPPLIGRVSTAEASIKLQADQIINKVNVNDFGTLVTQNAYSIRSCVGQIGGHNLLSDSNFEGGTVVLTDTSPATTVWIGVPDEPSAYMGDKCLNVSSGGGDVFIYTNLTTKVVAGTIYTISYHSRCAGSIDYNGSSSYIQYNTGDHFALPFSTGYGKTWVRNTCEWQCPPGITSIRLRFGLHMSGYAWFNVDCVQVEEGRYATAWTSNPNELKSSSFELTTQHARFTGQDGSYTEFCPNQTGLKWHKGSTSKDYHYLMYRGSISNVETLNAHRIYFPEEFRGKDYVVGWWSGNVFPKNAGDLLFSANVEFVDENRAEAWVGLKASIMMRNPNTESTPSWKGKMNIMYIVIA
ncbi:phage tail protein [Clostridium estertheticum]|uniref:phage tail spike protein n=1 Tax=Clostridium estertheticum TaxID=238834 RepID=UPI001CF15FEF|nr:phage tail spike protein [Clostridium estertheticum]MCB2308890.1 phage tail protein [Clostridium estertheticum]MCB2347302.1 phage tail protein [Clostridium estertheticum]MCB2351931.1 phage tail protein [Clostridium estertheticum]WAG48503.1 phage tail protein [Clostridium estertheticum]